MKLIVETDQKTIDECKKLFAEGYSNDAEYAIANGKPYEERLKGEWIIDGHHIRCNKCNEYICNTDTEGNKIPDNFCPNCGADMRKGAE